MKRDKWIDIARGILIIFVVFGHTAFVKHYSNWHTIIYWFHMPAFFYLSGYVYKSKSNLIEQLTYTSKKLLVPYFTLLICITTYRYLFTPMSTNLYDEVRNILLGGRFIDGYYAPFWFITCLWFTQLIYTATLKIPNHMAWFFIIALYVIAHYQPIDWKIPGDLDVSLYALLFFALGHKVKWLVNNYICFFGSILFIFAVYLALHGKILFALDMKQHALSGKYDIIIPLLGILMIIGISKLFSKIPLGDVFVPIGRESLFIMYLHLIVALEIYRIGIYQDAIQFVAFGLFVPMFIQSIYTFSKNKFKIFYKLG